MSAHSESFFLKSQGPFSVWPQPSSMQMNGVVSQGPTDFSAGHRPPSVHPAWACVSVLFTALSLFSTRGRRGQKKRVCIRSFPAAHRSPACLSMFFILLSRLTGQLQARQKQTGAHSRFSASAVSCWYRGAELWPWGGGCRVCLVPLLNRDFSLPVAPETVFQKLTTCVPHT